MLDLNSRTFLRSSSRSTTSQAGCRNVTELDNLSLCSLKESEVSGSHDPARDQDWGYPRISKYSPNVSSRRGASHDGKHSRGAQAGSPPRNATGRIARQVEALYKCCFESTSQRRYMERARMDRGWLRTVQYFIPYYPNMARQMLRTNVR